MSLMRVATSTALVFATSFLADSHAADVESCVAEEAFCRAAVNTPSLATEHRLLQHSIDLSSSVASPDDMVNDESGFEGAGEFGEIVDTGCTASEVRRRRRDTADICSCRRRDSGMRYDGGWRCQSDQMVQEEVEWKHPIWSEEFDDEHKNGSIDESKWTITDSGSGNGNNEQQWYTTRHDNVYIDDGVLKIVGKPEQYGGKPFTSAKITSRGHGDWGPGHRIEVRAKLPLGVGTWPAIWMMPTDSSYGGWPKSGEIDIMEAVGKSHGKVFGTIHTGAYNHMKGTHQGKSFYTDFSEWHTYALNWEEDKLTWYADGNLYNTFAPDDISDSAKWPFNRRFYLILNLAIGGNLGGSVQFSDDQVMEIDYVRIYCLDGSTTCRTITCCSECPGKSFCSPRSFGCYDEKGKDYYESCPDA